MNDTSRDVPEEVAAWAKLGDIAGQPKDLSAESRDELKHWLDAGQVTVDPETDKFFHLLGRYPIGVNRIDWRGVQGHLVFDVLPLAKEAMTAGVHEKQLAECHSMLVRWFNSSGIDLHERIVWIGDDSTVALHMTINTLLELYPRLFSWPQHHYVLPLTGEWCVNYTMEGQLFFGRAENARVHGQVDLDSP